MKREKTLYKIAKEIEKRVSATSNLQKEIYGVKSNLLDILFLDEKKEQRKEQGKIIKEELEKKIEIAKKHIPLRKTYIKNMERVIKDLEKRIQGKKTDDKRKQLLNLDKKNGFNNEILKEIADTAIANATTENTEQEEILKRLSKKKDYKEELVWLLKHRSGEVKNDIQKKNIQELTEKIKAVQEIERTTKKKNTKIQNMITTIRLLTALGLTTRGTIEFYENMKTINKTNKEKEKNILSKKEETPKGIVISLKKLQETISDTLLDEGITHKDIANAVNNIINKETKNNIIQFLYTGNILGLQEFLCMKKDSEYKLNKATGKIDKTTMNILTGGRFGMTEKEIMTNDTITQDVKDAYIQFVQGEIHNNGYNYLINSKICMHSFLLDKNHKLIDVQPIIIGRDAGKDQEYIPFSRFYENGIKTYYTNKKLNRNTPEGLFAIEGMDKLEERQYQIDGPKEAIIMDPIELTTKGLTYDETKIKMRDHPVFVADGLEYIEAINTPEITDNNKSKGCINHKNFGRIKDNLKTDPNGSRIYITQYTKYKNIQKKEELYASNYPKK